MTAIGKKQLGIMKGMNIVCAILIVIGIGARVYHYNKDGF